MNAWPALGFGVGLRATHYREFLQSKPKLDWLEVHSENYIAPGGMDIHVLQQLRQDYPLSLHGVGMGIGSARGFSLQHVQSVADLAQRVEPAIISEHLCWGAVQDRVLNELLPLSFGWQVLELICNHVDQVQDILRRPILLENVSTYVRFHGDEWSETAFLAEVAKRTGCGILLDVNNLYVNQCNHGEDAYAALLDLQPGTVGEIHLAGHRVRQRIVVDDHGSEVCPEVWEIYRAAIHRFGVVASLIEWDTNLPPLATLLQQAQLAREHAARPQAALVVSGAERGKAENGNSALDAVLTQQYFSNALFVSEHQEQILPLLAMPPDLAQYRFGLYRSSMRSVWATVLGHAYPVLKMLMGEEFFHGLAGLYGERHPSQSANLNFFGVHFASFLQTAEEVAEYPYFADMARLEWGLHSLYYQADVANALSVQDIAQLNPEQLDASRFQLSPLCLLLQSEWAVDKIWQAHQSNPVGEFPDPLQQHCHILLTRPRWQAQMLPISAAAHCALTALASGSTIGDALDAALEMDEEFPFIEQLQFWLAHQVLLPGA